MERSTGRAMGRLRGGCDTARETLRDERGATAIEYAMLAAMIATGFILIVTGLGDTIRDMYARVQSTFEATQASDPDEP